MSAILSTKMNLDKKSYENQSLYSWRHYKLTSLSCFHVLDMYGYMAYRRQELVGLWALSAGGLIRVWNRLYHHCFG